MPRKKIVLVLKAVIISSVTSLCLLYLSDLGFYLHATPEQITTWFPRFGAAWLFVRSGFVTGVWLIVAATTIFLGTRPQLLRNIINGWFFLGGSYVLLSLIFGENHPFTRMPVYNSFPNFGYSFYLSDKEQKMFPARAYFNYNAGELSHIYFSICRENEWPVDKNETPEELSRIGEIMTAIMKQREGAHWPEGIVQLHRVCYFMSNDSIHKKDTILNETCFK
jgi:hypothetical protein